jgi:hypothetical protein
MNGTIGRTMEKYVDIDLDMEKDTVKKLSKILYILIKSLI